MSATLRGYFCFRCAFLFPTIRPFCFYCLHVMRIAAHVLTNIEANSHLNESNQMPRHNVGTAKSLQRHQTFAIHSQRTTNVRVCDSVREIKTLRILMNENISYFIRFIFGPCSHFYRLHTTSVFLREDIWQRSQ